MPDEDGGAVGWKVDGDVGCKTFEEAADGKDGSRGAEASSMASGFEAETCGWLGDNDGFTCDTD